MAELKGVDGVGNMKTRFSSSRLSGVERHFDPVATESKHGSILDFVDNSKCNEADMQLSEGGASTQLTSVKSEISIETHLPLRNGSSENHINAAEDGPNTMTHDSQHRTESSCSNSLPVVLPVSFSNQSYQETSKEACLFRNCGSSMDSSNSKAFDRSPEELVTASSESVISAQIASKAIRNAKARNSMKISSMAGNHSSLMTKKVDGEISHKWDHETATPEDDVAEVLEQTEMYKWIARNTSSFEEQNPVTVGKSHASSDNLDSFNCIGKIAQSTRLSDGHGHLPTSHCGERTEYEISREGENLFVVKGEALEDGPEVVNKFRGEFWVNKYSESLMTKLSKYAVKDQDKSIAGFDLNEDINANVLDDFIQPVAETISSHRVIHVVAKAGILIGQPMIPLKFEGGLGWKGSAETSAFRPASLSKDLDRRTHSTDQGPKDLQCFTGIDLNVAAVENNDAKGILLKHEGISSHSALQESHLEVESKQTKSLLIDLNCPYDASDEFTQPYLPSKSENLPRVDINLNSHTSVAENFNSVHWLGQGNKISDASSSGKHDFDFTSHDYLANWSTMRHLANSAHTLVTSPKFLQPVEFMQRVASPQPKLSLISHVLPPHGYPYMDPFHFSAGSMPYTRFYGGHTSLNTPHLAQVVHEQSTGNISAAIPKFDNKTEDNLSISGSKMDHPRQFPFIPKGSPMGERMHQEAWYAASVKRKEPEGGLEYYQLGYKQVL